MARPFFLLLVLLPLAQTQYMNVATIAGTVTTPLSVTETLRANETKFLGPAAVAVCASSGAVYIADAPANRLHVLASDGVMDYVYFVAGSGAADPFADGLGSAATFSAPAGLALSADCATLYVADTGHHRIRAMATAPAPAVSAIGSVATLAGSGVATFVDGAPATAAFSSPRGLCLYGSALYVADYANHRVRVVDASTGYVSTLVGSGVAQSVDGAGTGASFYYPVGVAVAAGTTTLFTVGTLFVAEAFAARVRCVLANSNVTRCVAGCLPGASAFKMPGGLAVDASHTVYVADTGSNQIKRVYPSLPLPVWSAVSQAYTGVEGRTLVVAGAGGNGNYGDGEGGSASFNAPADIAMSAQSATDTNPWFAVADAQSFTVRRLRSVNSNSPSVSASSSSSGTASMSSSPSATPSPPASRSISATPSLSSCSTGTITPSVSGSITGTTMVSRTRLPTISASTSSSQSASAAGSGTVTITASSSSSPNATRTASTSASTTSTGTQSPSAVVTTSGTLTESGQVSASTSTSPTASRAASGTTSPSAAASAIPSPSSFGTVSPVASPSATLSALNSPSPSPSAAGTPTNIPFNHPPTIAFDGGASCTGTSNFSRRFLEAPFGSGSLLLAPDLALCDAESQPLLYANFSLAGCVAGDLLSPPDLPPFMVAAPFFSAPPQCWLTLHAEEPGFALTSPLRLSDWQAVLRGVAFSSAAWGAAGSNATRTVTLEVVDSSGLDAEGRLLLLGPLLASAAFPLFYVPFNNAPSLALAGLAGDAAGAPEAAYSPSWTAAENFTLIAPTAVASDSEGVLAAANVTLGACVPGSQLQLLAPPRNGSGIALLLSGGCTVLLAGRAPPANYTALLRGLYFASSAVNPKAAPSVDVALCVSDVPPPGALNGPQGACLTLTLRTDENEPPLLLAVPPQLQLSELTNALDGSAAPALVASLVAGDWDPADAPALRVVATGLAPPGPGGAAVAGALFSFSALAGAGGLRGALPATSFSLGVSAGWLLANVTAKSFLLSLEAVESSGALAALRSLPAPMEVLVVRANSAVTFGAVPAPPLPINQAVWGIPPWAVVPPAYAGLQGADGALGVGLAENSPVGTRVGPVLAAYDADAIQSLSYSIVNCSLVGAGAAAPAAPCPAGLFALLPGAPAAVADPWGTGAQWSVTRNATLVVGLDALDFEYLPMRRVLVAVQVTDDAAQHSPLLPAVPRTSAWLTINITLRNDPSDDAPAIASVAPLLGAPLNGVATAGGESVLLTGRGLGLPLGPASAVRGMYTSVACAALGAEGAAGAGCTLYASPQCTVTARLAAVVCTTAPGFGSALAWRLLIGTGDLATDTGWSTATMAYRAPVLRNVSLAPSHLHSLIPAAAGPLAHPESPGSTAGGTLLLLRGEDFPAAGLTPENASASAALNVSYGPTGVEFSPRCVVVANFSALLCRAEPGAGAGLPWSVRVGGLGGATPALSYGAPVIKGVSPAQLSTVGGELVTLTGENFGPAGPANTGGNGGGGATLGWVSYTPGAPVPGLPTPVFAAANCAVVVADTKVQCTTAPGWGLDLRWRLSVAGVASAPFAAGNSYWEPVLSSATLLASTSLLANATLPAAQGQTLLLSTAGAQLLDLRGTNFSTQGVASAQFFNSSLPSPLVYQSHNRLIMASSAGMGAGKWLTLSVGAKSTRFPVAFQAPSITVATLTGQNPNGDLKLQLVGSNFGACCFCARSRCVVDKETDPYAVATSDACAATAGNPACLTASCEFTGGAPDFRLQYQANGSAVVAPDISPCRITSYTDTVISFIAPNVPLAQIRLTVAGQASPAFVFNLQSALSTLPTLATGLYYCGDATAFVPSKESRCGTAGGGSLEIVGKNLQKVGNVYFELSSDGSTTGPAAGAIKCPPVFSTALIDRYAPWSSFEDSCVDSQCCPNGKEAPPPRFVSQKYSEYKSGTINDATLWWGVQTQATQTGLSALYYVDAKGRATPLAGITDAIALNKTIDPLASYVADATVTLADNTTVRGVAAWVKLPLLCYVTHWYQDATPTNLCGSATVSVPPGQGTLRAYTNSYTTNTNSTGYVTVQYDFASGATLAPLAPGGGKASGLTGGDIVEVRLQNAPPSEYLYDLWGPFLLDAQTPGTIITTPAVTNREATTNSALYFSYVSSGKYSPLVEATCLRPALAWNSTYIKCRAPPGFSSALMYLFLFDLLGAPAVDPRNLYLDSGQAFVGNYLYKRGTLFQMLPPVEVPVVGASRALRFWGESLGRSASIVAGVASNFVIQPQANTGLFGDRIAGGLTSGSSIQVLNHTDSYVDLLIPGGMGVALLKFLLPLPSGVQDSRSAIDTYAAVNRTTDFGLDVFQFNFAKPRVLNITAENDPCTGLEQGASCFAATNLDKGASAGKLTLTGLNFGYSTLPPSILISGGECTVQTFVSPLPVSDPNFVTAVQQIVCTMKVPVFPSRNVPVTLRAANWMIEKSSSPSPPGVPDPFAGVRLDAACPKDLYPLTLDTKPCAGCPPGGECKGGFEQPEPKATFWLYNETTWVSMNMGRPLDTTSGPNFLVCPAPASACTGGASLNPCVLGHEGFMCSRCTQGYGRTAAALCKPCADNQLQAFILAATILVYCFVLGFFIRGTMTSKKKDATALVFKMVTNHAQLVGALNVFIKNAAKKGESPLTWLFQATSAASVNIDSGSYDCLGIRYQHRLYALLALPVLAMAIPSALIALYEGAALLLCGKRWRGWARVGQLGTASAVILLFFMHNSIVVQTQQYFQCAPTAEGGYLLTDPSVSCHTEEYNTTLWAVLALSALWSAGIPIAGMVQLLRLSKREELQQKKTQKYWGFMYNGMSQAFTQLPCGCGRVRIKLLWEPLVMLRKAAFVLIGVWVNVFLLQMYLGFGLIVLCLWQVMYVSPYEDPAFTSLEAQSLLANALLFVAVLVMDLGVNQKVSGVWVDTVVILVAIFNAYVLLLFVFIVINAKYQAWKDSTGQKGLNEAVKLAKERGKVERRVQGVGAHFDVAGGAGGGAEGGAQPGATTTLLFERGNVEQVTRTKLALDHARAVGLRHTVLHTMNAEDLELVEAHAGELLGVDWERRWALAPVDAAMVPPPAPAPAPAPSLSPPPAPPTLVGTPASNGGSAAVEDAPPGRPGAGATPVSSYRPQLQLRATPAPPPTMSTINPLMRTHSGDSAPSSGAARALAALKGSSVVGRSRFV